MVPENLSGVLVLVGVTCFRKREALTHMFSPIHVTYRSIQQGEKCISIDTFI